MKTIYELRKLGHKVRVHHLRFLGDSLEQYHKDFMYALKAKGGRTQIEITTPYGATVKGVADCSRKENFNRKVGLTIALGRALNQLE